MPLYLTISRGPRADQATPVLASSDRSVVATVLAAIARLDEPGGEAGSADDHSAFRRSDLRVLAGDVGDDGWR